MIIKVAYAVAHFLLFVGFILPSPSLKFLLLRNIWSCEILLRNSPRSFETTPTCYIILCGSIGNGELWLWVPICHTVSAKFPKNFRIFPHSFEWESTRKKKAPTQVTVGPYRLAVLHLNFIRVTRLWTEIHSGSGGLMIFSSTSSSELHRRPAPEDGEAQHFMNSHGHPHKSSSHRQTGSGAMDNMAPRCCLAFCSFSLQLCLLLKGSSQ